MSLQNENAECTGKMNSHNTEVISNNVNDANFITEVIIQIITIDLLLLNKKPVDMKKH